MQPTLVRRALQINQHEGRSGMQPWTVRPDYKTFKSEYGPQYKVSPHFHGISMGRAARFGITMGGFGAVAGIFALFFFDGVPRVQKDILQKIPVIGDFFVHEVPPEDNPF